MKGWLSYARQNSRSNLCHCELFERVVTKSLVGHIGGSDPQTLDTERVGGVHFNVYLVAYYVGER